MVKIEDLNDVKRNPYISKQLTDDIYDFSL